jgi:hypothetical protein
VPSKKTIRELLEAMVITSDNIACDKLLAILGGPRVVDARIRSLGIDHITIRYSEMELGAGKDNTTTPVAMIALLAKIARHEVGLSATSAALLEDILLRVTTGQQRIKGALPPGTLVAHKTGMSDTRWGTTDATNDVGLITLPDGHRIAVAVFVHASPADITTRERTIALSRRRHGYGALLVQDAQPGRLADRSTGKRLESAGAAVAAREFFQQIRYASRIGWRLLRAMHCHSSGRCSTSSRIGARVCWT